MPVPSADTALDDLKNAFATSGVRGAMALLNSLSPHRFTSLYQFDGGTLRNITFYDRENPAVEKSDDIPVEASYCVFVRDTAARFSLEDSQEDGRVHDHPKRPVVQRYCGVPLLDARDQMFGSICHFDFAPGPISNRDVELLEYMARILRPTL